MKAAANLCQGGGPPLRQTQLPWGSRRLHELVERLEQLCIGVGERLLLT